jgi:CoA:oxalate CoA-transferase
VVVAVFVDRFWPAFCDAVGLPALSERYPTNPERVEHRDELVGFLEARFREERTASWVARLRAAGVPCGPVSTVDQVLADPQVRHRAMVAETARAHPVAGTHHLVGNPVKVDSPDRYDPAPLLGEHNEAVYDGLLGLDEDALAALRRDGVI